MKTRCAALAIAAVAAAATGAPAAAHGATLTADFPCYSDGESIVFTGTGFTPDGRVSLSAGGRQVGALRADFEGGFSTRVRLPRLFDRARLRFVAADRAEPSLIAGELVRIAAPDVVIAPAGGRPTRLRRIRAWGFIGTGALYAHVKRRGARRARNIRLGFPRGACGIVDVKRRLFHRSPRAGRYTVKFDAAPRYLRAVNPSVVYDLSIFR